MLTLLALVVLPLAAIATQRLLGLHGAASSLYKLCFLIPTLIYCRVHGIGVWNDILKLRNWQRGLGVALGLGGTAIVVFWTAYFFLSDLLLCQEKISESIARQFLVNTTTVFIIAPITIFLNSLLEEFFYRGFAFGLLVRRSRWLGYSLPAAAFTAQHVLFFWQWLQWIPFCIALAGLLVFALALQRLYETADTIVAPWVVHMGGDIAMMGIAVTLFRF